MFLTYAAVGIAHPPLFRNGSYTSLLTHKRCSNTANLRAVAVMAFLPVSASTLGQLQAPAPQSAVRPKRSQNVLRTLHHRGAQIGISFRTDVHLRLALPRVSPPRLQPQLRRFSCWRTCWVHCVALGTIATAMGRMLTFLREIKMMRAQIHSGRKRLKHKSAAFVKDVKGRGASRCRP
jgi:hypothetical protein